MSENGINKWLKNYQDKEIIDIKFSGGWGMMYGEKFL